MHPRSRPQTLNLNNFNSNRLNESPLTLCSYLPDRVSKLIYLPLHNNEGISSKLYTRLAQNGFRRSGDMFYRPNCQHCMQCISSRVVVNDFAPSRRYRKVLNRNKTVSLHVIDASQVNEEHYGLYQKYISMRHADGDMYPPSLHTFEQFLVDSPVSTRFIEFREPNNKLIAVAVTDTLDNGLSSVYTFFEPSEDYQKRSLGVFAILKQIELAQQWQLDHVYLGFWIPSVQKMRYKTDYAPVELLIHGEWQRFDTTPEAEDVMSLLNTISVEVTS